MSTLTRSFLAIALLSLVGCALTPKAVAQRKQIAKELAAEQYLAARRLEGQGRFELARQRYKEMLETDRNNPEYLHRLGVVCTQLQRFGEASYFYDRAREVDPKNPSLIGDMGYAAYLRKDYVVAERLLRQAQHMKPSDKRTTSNLALVVGVKGNLDESLSLLREVEDEPNALASLAYIHAERGEIDLAEQRYKEALAINPSLTEATEALAQLEKLRPQGGVAAVITIKEDDPVEDSAAFADADIPSGNIQLVSGAEESESAVVTAALLTEDLPATKEPALLRETSDKSGRASLNTKTKEITKFNSGFDDDLLSTSLVPTLRRQRIQRPDWSDEEFTEQEPVAPKRSKKTSPLLQASFELFDDDELDFKKPAKSTRSKVEDEVVRPRKANVDQTPAADASDDDQFSLPLENE